MTGLRLHNTIEAGVSWWRCVQVLEQTGGGHELCVDGVPRTRNDAGALNDVAVAGIPSEAEADAGGNRLNADWRQSFTVNDGRRRPRRRSSSGLNES